MPLAAVQLGYPGQHVAAIYRQQIEDPILKIHRGGFPYLAWGFYTATLMFEQGYFKTPIERLIYHRERLLNALRLVIDIKYHVHEQTMDELTTLLVEEGGLQQANAEREGRRYASQPTHQVALMIGLQKIEELKQAIQKKLGNKFTLAHFHQILLSAGHLPAEVILSLYNKGLLQLVSFDDKKAPAKASKAVKKPAAAKKTAPAKKPAAKKPAAKKPAAAKSGTAKKAAPAKKTPAKKAAPKKGPVKSSAKKTAAKTITKSTAKKPAAKKTAAKKAAPVKKSTTSRASSSRSKASTSRTKSAASGSSSKTKRTTAKSVTKPAAKAKATAKAKSTSSSSKAKKAAKPTATHSKTAARRSPAKGKSTSRKRS
jgi:DNA polymerase III gamma/tau subunit